MKPSERIKDIEDEIKKGYTPLGENGFYTTDQLCFISFQAIKSYMDEQAESQEPKALEEKPCVMFLAKKDDTGDRKCSVCGFYESQHPAKPQEKPCKECHSRSGHARRCSMRREGSQEEPKLPQSDFRMNPEEVVKAGKDWWDLQKETEPKEDPVQAERQRILDLPCMQEEEEPEDADGKHEIWALQQVVGRNFLRREIRDALQSK